MAYVLGTIVNYGNIRSKKPSATNCMYKKYLFNELTLEIIITNTL